MATVKNRAAKLSAFAQMLRDKREKLAPDTPFRDFCAKRGFDAPTIADMEADRRTAPGTYAALYKLASGYGHQPDDRWTTPLLDAAVGKAPTRTSPASAAPRGPARSSAMAKRDGRSNGSRNSAPGSPPKARRGPVTRGR